MSAQIPHTFIAGTKAIAAQVNENFNYVLNNTQEIKTSLENQIIDLKSDMLEIQDNTGDVIMNLNEIGAQITFDAHTLTIKGGLSVSIPNGLDGAGGDSAESLFIKYTLINPITKEYSSAATSAVLSLDNSGEIREYASYIEAAAEPEESSYTLPCLFYNTAENKMYKKAQAVASEASTGGNETQEGEEPAEVQNSFVQCFEAKIADGFSRGEDGTITAVNSLIPPNIILSADRVHTAAIKVSSNLMLPELSGSDKFVNALIEFTLNTNAALTLPDNLRYSGGEPPELIANGTVKNRLIFDTTNGGADWMCYFNSDGE